LGYFTKRKLPAHPLARLTAGLHFPYRQLILCAPGASEVTPKRNGSLRYLFEDYALDTDRRELHRATDVIVVTPQVFDLLDYLIRNRERVVGKDDLIAIVWKGRIVTDAALTTRLSAARNAIGDTGEKQRLIKTLPRKGFRFIGAVQEDDARTVAPPDSVASGVHTQPPRLSIVVLPFASLSADPEQDYFVDGVTESLTTDLSRINGAFVIAHSTALTFKRKAVDVTKLGRELNVRYVLEGSAQRGSHRLRVNVQLIDAETGAHLWADRFDKPIADLFDMQDEIVSRLANALHAQLTVQEARRSERSAHPSSMDLYFQGRALLYKSWMPDCLAQANEIFERALVLDPDNIDATLWKAAVNLVIGTSYLSDEKARRVAAVETTLYKVLSLAPNHAWGHAVLGTLLVATNRPAEGLHEFERALALDSNLAEAHAQIGWTKYFMGRSAETEAHINEAFRLSPHDIFAYRWMMMIGFAKLHLNADAEALDWFRRSIEANRNSFTHFGLAAALALLGARDEARAAAKAGLALMPSFTIRRFREGALTDNPTYLANRERIYQGLRVAGVPEG
jgi:TolB-like protein/Tfp pilus assembly protein PilF